MPSLRMASRITANACWPDLAVWNDVVRVAQVQLVNIVLHDELLDLDRVLALDGNGFQFLGIKLDILALADLVALDDVGLLNLVAGLGVDFSIPDTIAGLLVELVEADLFPLRSGGEKRNRAGNQREFQKALPIRTRRHGTLLRKRPIEFLTCCAKVNLAGPTGSQNA